ncbi:hypothetical protein AB0M47_42330 [Hamadaea sp. NPDC051192]|uniref:hypothetical protein n=1 Tax=Hamadaea sp. NPDC051192 TaxID=3154940 RepID=UPI003446634E
MQPPIAPQPNSQQRSSEQPSSRRVSGFSLKWWHLAIAGVFALFLLCSCGIGAYLVLYRSSSGEPSGQPPGSGASDKAAGCREALLGGPGSDAQDVSPEETRKWSAFYRGVAEKATDPKIRAAILALADDFEQVAHAQEVHDTDPSFENAKAEADALREMLDAQIDVSDLCIAAGYAS